MSLAGRWMRRVRMSLGPAVRLTARPPKRLFRLVFEGCSFQFGRTSICRPLAPHFRHFIRAWNDGTGTSSG